MLRTELFLRRFWSSLLKRGALVEHVSYGSVLGMMLETVEHPRRPYESPFLRKLRRTG